LIFPVAVKRNLFAAPLCVFSFGIIHSMYSFPISNCRLIADLDFASLISDLNILNL